VLEHPAEEFQSLLFVFEVFPQRSRYFFRVFVICLNNFILVSGPVIKADLRLPPALSYMVGTQRYDGGLPGDLRGSFMMLACFHFIAT
jgi:hypothetical protein